MAIMAFFVATLVSLFSVYGVVRRFRRTTSVPRRILSVVSCLWSVVLVFLLASLTTVAMQTRVIMLVLSFHEPAASIIATDATMARQMESAVKKGLSKKGDVVGNVQTAVLDVVHPYMAYRFSHADDKVTILFGRSMRDSLRVAKAKDPGLCMSARSGDLSAIREIDGHGPDTWIAEIIRAEPMDEARVADEVEFSEFVSGVMASRGWTVDGVANQDARMTCEYPISLIDAALGLPPEEAAPILRRMFSARRSLR